MANYNLVINSKFNPFSYQEMLTPVLMATQAHQELENQYGELDAKASVWENLANEQSDPTTYKQYKTYANSLKNAADQLAREGLNTTSRRNMLNLRSRYNKEIMPIEQAYAARAEEAKSQYAGRAQGMVYEGDASMSSLDRYLSNPSIRYRQANSAEGFKRLATTASALAKGLSKYGIGESLDAYTKTWLQEHGYRDTDIASAISDIQRIVAGDTNIKTNGVLRAILEDEMNTSGVNEWQDISAKLDYFNKVAPALYQAVGQTQVSTFEDYGARLSAQEAMQKRMANYKGNSNDKENQGNNVRHWEGVLLKGDFDSKMYNNLLSKLTLGGKGLSQNYFGKKFVNPLKVYEEAIKYAKEHPVIETDKDENNLFTDMYTRSVGARSAGGADYSFKNAIDVMKKKYGVSSTLTHNEYMAMKNLGFNSSSSATDMYSDKIAKAIDSQLILHRASALNSGNLDYALDIINTNMARENQIYDIDTLDKIDFSDLDKNDLKSGDIAYSYKHKGKILRTVGNRRIAIPAESHSAEAKNIVEFYESLIEQASSNAEIAELQDLASLDLENLFNSYNKSRTRTSSKR